MGGFIIFIGLIVFGFGLVGAVRGQLKFARITTRKLGAIVTASGFVIMMIGGAVSPKSSTSAHRLVSASGTTTTEKPSSQLAVGSATSVPVGTTPPTTVASTTAAPTAPPTTSAPPPTSPPPTTAPQTQAPVVTAAPTPPPPAPTAALCGAPQNPMGYNYCGRGSLIASPDPHTCSYFSCINNFFNGSGYMEECNDGMVSMSGGRRGACSYHGGEQRPVYSG